MVFDNSSLLFVKQSVKKPKKYIHISQTIIYCHLSLRLSFSVLHYVILDSNKHEVSHIKEFSKYVKLPSFSF